jgi:hypothetical protein
LVGKCYPGWKLHTAPEIYLELPITRGAQQSISFHSPATTLLSTLKKLKNLGPPLSLLGLPLFFSGVSQLVMLPGVTPIYQRN